jgi:hypothetical protein
MKRIVGLMIITGLVSCTKKSDDGPSFTKTEGTVTKITVTNSVSIGQDVTVTVDYLGAQSCDEPGHIERAQVGKTITVHAFYKHPNTKDPCLDSPAQLQQTFNFKPLVGGQYIFKSPTDDTISDTLMVF